MCIVASRIESSTLGSRTVLAFSLFSSSSVKSIYEIIFSTKFPGTAGWSYLPFCGSVNGRPRTSYRSSFLFLNTYRRLSLLRCGLSVSSRTATGNIRNYFSFRDVGRKIFVRVSKDRRPLFHRFSKFFRIPKVEDRWSYEARPKIKRFRLSYV